MGADRVQRRQAAAKARKPAAKRASSNGAKAAPPAPPAAATPKVVPYKLVCQLIVQVKDENGDVVREADLSELVGGGDRQALITIFASQFGKVQEICDTEWLPMLEALAAGTVPAPA